MTTLEFDKPSHTYRFNGARLPSVTQVLDSLGTYAGIPPEVLARKAEIGDAVHLCTELYDRDELDRSSVPEEIEGYFRAWLKFRADTDFEPLDIERRVHSKRYGFAGTLDRMGHFHALRLIRPHRLAQVDLKATYRILPAVGPQTAGYNLAYREETKVAPRHRFVCRLMPDGKYELKECVDTTDESVFRAALTLFAWRQRHGLSK